MGYLSSTGAEVNARLENSADDDPSTNNNHHHHQHQHQQQLVSVLQQFQHK